MDDESIILDDLISHAADELLLSLERSRRSFSHNLTSGESTEAAVRQFFRDHYPDSIGVGHGQVVDVHGSRSTQLDIVLYDKARTPILFSDKENGNRLFPAEGVIAAIEVKSSVTSADLSKAAANAKVLKNLARVAYIESLFSPLGLQSQYGRVWETTPPPLFIVLAFEGPKLETVVRTLREAHLRHELWERVDTTCILSRGITLNTGLGGDSYSIEPQPGSLLQGNRMLKPLLFLHVMLSTHVLQRLVPPINLVRYLPDGFNFGELKRR